MKDFILRNIERVFSLLLTGIFLAQLYFGNEKGLHLWFDSGRESGSLGLVTGIFIFFVLALSSGIWILTDKFLLFILTKMGYYSEDWSKVVGVIVGKRIAKAPRTSTNHFLVVKVGEAKRNFFVSRDDFYTLEKGDSLWLRKVRVHYKGRVVRTYFELAERY